MPDIADGESVQFESASGSTYTLKNIGGVYSCSCPAWQYQGGGIEQRSCKHLRAYRGEEAETARVGSASRAAPARRASSSPSSSSSASSGVSGVAPKVLLAKSWDESDPTGWWMSEKLDGVRAWWDGERFISRQGNVYMAPNWFVENLPDEVLDGELFVGRGEFQRCVSIVRRYDQSDEWKRVRYLVFDAPEHGGLFEARYEHLRSRIAGLGCDYTHLVAHELCESIDHLRAELARIESLGGEGLMLRQPRSRYVGGRSSSLLKVKSFHDAEARVIDHLPGTGKHEGRLGALRVVLPDGTEFSIGTGFSDAEREDPPPVGSIVTFRYQELTNAGVPRFPSWVGVRHDLAWEQINWPPASHAALAAITTAERARLPVADLTGVEPAPPPPRRPRPAAPAAASPAAPAPPPAPEPPVVEVSRQLQFEGAKSTRFFEIEQDGRTLTIASGRIGRDPKVETRTFASKREAAEEANRLAEAKIEKGYEEF